MPQAILKACDPARKTKVAKGTILLQEGTTTGSLYVLASGTVAVLRGPIEVAQVFEPGAVFGETSVLLGLPHTATVRAKTDCEIFAFEDAANFVRGNPEITYEIAVLLAGRLQKANDFITDLNESARNAANIWAW